MGESDRASLLCPSPSTASARGERGVSGSDADHLALATFHKCDILVTWNCQHIANANKFPHIRRINAMLGYATLQLITPLELLGNETD